MTVSSFTARYHGRCFTCDAAIIPGDTVSRQRRASRKGHGALWVTLCRACGRRAEGAAAVAEERERGAWANARRGGGEE